MEALKLLKKNRTTEERAEKYTERIKSSLTIKIITNLEEKIEKIADNIYDLENFNLSTVLQFALFFIIFYRIFLSLQIFWTLGRVFEIQRFGKNRSSCLQ